MLQTQVHSFPIDQYTIAGRLDPDPATGRAAAPEAAGTGVAFDWEKLAPHLVRSGTAGGAAVEGEGARATKKPKL
eukprot:SAG11_NODE_2011_length_3925_cov_7.509148_1_plen_75_part_00